MPFPVGFNYTYLSANTVGIMHFLSHKGSHLSPKKQTAIAVTAIAVTCV
jgi:hypothetical protein